MVAALVFCAGCATINELNKVPASGTGANSSSQQSKAGTKTAETDAAPVSAPKSPAQIALSEGIALYDKGDFNGAIKRISGAAEIWSAEKSIQTEALKYMAFSYCVTTRQTLCRQQFDKALKLDPDFDLAPGEKGHPLWGPAFGRVKRANK